MLSLEMVKVTERKFDLAISTRIKLGKGTILLVNLPRGNMAYDSAIFGKERLLRIKGIRCG